MEEWTVVSFFMDRDMCGKYRRRDAWRYHVEEREFDCEAGRVRLLNVSLPVYGRKKKPWKKEEKASYLQGLQVPEEGRMVCYLYGEGADLFLGRQREPLSFEWSLFLLQYFKTDFEALLLLEDRGLETADWVRQFARMTRYIGILSDNPEKFEDMAEELLTEYGFILDAGEDIRSLHPPKEKVMIVAEACLYGITPSILPKNFTWLSVSTTDTGGKRICSRTKQGNYLDIYRFLRANSGVNKKGEAQEAGKP